MFGRDVDDDAIAHAVESFPYECGGFVIAGRYLRIKNIAKDRAKHFEFAPEAWIEHGDVKAVIHSHCAPAKREPSFADMRSQIDTDVPWGIVLTDGKTGTSPLWWGDFILDEPLIGRQYLWGVRDCWSIIRSSFWQQRKILLIDIARDQAEFLAGADMMMANAKRTGFRVIPEAEAQPGDMIFMKIRNAMPNHCCVLIENGLILHHLPGRLSYRQPLGNWRRQITDYLRYDP